MDCGRNVTSICGDTWLKTSSTGTIRLRSSKVFSSNFESAHRQIRLPCGSNSALRKSNFTGIGTSSALITFTTTSPFLRSSPARAYCRWT